MTGKALIIDTPALEAIVGLVDEEGAEWIDVSLLNDTKLVTLWKWAGASDDPDEGFEFPHKIGEYIVTNEGTVIQRFETVS